MKLPLLVFSLGFVCLFGSRALGSSDSDSEDKAKSGPTWFVDDDGMRQWVTAETACNACEGSGEAACERKVVNTRGPCSECDDSQHATCRSCTGKGVQYDPLVEMICSYCDGSGLWVCGNCFGKGGYRPEGGGKKGQKCGPCKATGTLKCEACKGKRRIKVAKVSPRLGDAKAKPLMKARAKIAAAVQQLKAFKPYGNESEDMKAFVKALGKAKGPVAALKGAEAMAKSGLKAVRVSAQYTSYELQVALQFKELSLRTIVLLQHQMALIDRCLERLEFNDQVRNSK